MVHARALVFGGVMAVFGAAVFELGPIRTEEVPVAAALCVAVHVADCPAAAITSVTQDFERHEVVQDAPECEQVCDESFTIRVVDEAGRPVAGANVAYWTRYRGTRIETDARGSCALEERPSAVAATHPLHGLSVELNLLEALASASRDRPSRWRVDESECTLVLNRTVTASGVLFGGDGDPQSGVYVFANFTPDFTSQDPASRFTGYSRTDEFGRFEIEVLPDAEYELSARMSSCMESTHRCVAVRRHPVTGIVIEMFGRCRITLRGRDSSGAAVPLEWADALDETPTHKMRFHGDAMGLVVERAGEYLVGVTAEDRKWWAAPRRLFIDEFAREATFDFVPATRLAGLVLDPAGQPIAIERIQVDWWLPDVERQADGSDGSITSSDENGEFECFIPPGASASVIARDTGWVDSHADFELRARGFFDGLGPSAILRLERFDVGDRPVWRDGSPNCARLTLLLDHHLAAGASRCRFDLRTLNSQGDYRGDLDAATRTVNFESCELELAELIVTPLCGRLSDFDPRLFQPRVFDLRSGGEHRLALTLR